MGGCGTIYVMPTATAAAVYLYENNHRNSFFAPGGISESIVLYDKQYTITI